MSLSQLWQQQGRGDDARQVLSDVYGWFTEGFETVDLKQARELLEQIGGGGKRGKMGGRVRSPHK